jgi:hypothetical protein
MATAATAQHASVAHQELMIEFNERSADELAAFDFGEFLCECADRDCLETVTLAHTDYLRIRSSAGSFVLSPGHAETAERRVRLYVVSTNGDVEAPASG